ncbi:preprotein translocase subunit SecE [Brevundimonas aveniformis]|uniref:preprotein translocase subunit SecE n=1 Tax=Brevundimonas aveniformis TaxID=370977 RepID=UPI0003FCAEFE|nr:preprotein translocase subunit SecE [Brevundimonas aveniformis]
MAKAKSSSRGGGTTIVQGGAVTAPEADAPKKRISPMQFFSQVRAEGRKITWPSRKETWITSVMVFIMVALASLFFWAVDLLMALVASQLIQIGR